MERCLEISRDVIAKTLQGTCIDPKSIEIIFVDDMFASAKQYTTCESQIRDLANTSAQTIRRAQLFNGLFLFPRTTSEKHIILISNTQKKEYLYASTVSHEVKHVIDFNEYCEERCIGNYNILINSEYFDYVRLWSEFQAHKVGHITFVTYTQEQLLNNSREQQRKTTIDTQLDIFSKCLNDDICCDGDKCMKLESIIRLFGKHCAWQHLYGIDDNLIPDPFKDLYIFLAKENRIMSVDIDCLVDVIDSAYNQM